MDCHNLGHPNSNSPTSHGPSASTSANEAIVIRGIASKPETMLRVKNVILLKEVNHIQYLSDQLTLFEPGRADYPHLLLLAPQMFFTFRHH